MIDNPKQYWRDRYARQGYLTTGFNGHNKSEMELNYKQRFDWLDTFLPQDRKNVLDYGCGTGRYCRLFSNCAYVGMDIEQRAVDLAKEMNPKYYFDNIEHLKDTYYIDRPSVLFTSTVLQHNTDEEVKTILSLFDCKLWLYEFTGQSDAPHMASRTVKDYERLAGRKCERSYSHITHGQEHTLMIFK